jgi:type I restriction enzyme, S subunit
MSSGMRSMSAAQRLLTDQLDLWSAAETEKKSGRGRSAANASGVYGIKKLRELILELAVRGKLVPQDANDEPASELLKWIQAEKARLIAAGKIKKDKPLPAITEEEKPFDLAHGWQWIRLNDLLRKIGAGSTPLGGKQVYLDEGIPFLRSQNVWDEGLRLDDVAFISLETHLKMFGTHVYAGDLLFNITGASIGRCAIVPESFATGNVSQHVTIVRSVSKEILQFLHLVLVSRHVQKTVMDVQVGVSREGLSIGKLGQFIIPIPPLSEQHRIVAKVDELMALCDQLETRHGNAADAHEKLVSQLLATLTQAQDAADFAANWQRIAAHFDTLFCTEASIDTLKQTLLQLAVMGKLVPQDPNDEPASELLKRIQAEKVRLIAEGKLKKEKPLASFNDEEKPFSLPQSWRWVRFSELTTKITDGTHHTPSYIDSGIPFLSVKDLSSGVIDFSSTRFISVNEHDQLSKRCNPEFGDLLLTKVGTTGIPVVVDTARPFSIFVSVALIKAPWDLVNVEYLRLLVSSPFVKKQSAEGTEGVGNKNLVLRKIAEFFLAIPPADEQHRIVAKVNQLIALCDQLKARLATATQLQQKLADVLVEQALA